MTTRLAVVLVATVATASAAAWRATSSHVGNAREAVFALAPPTASALHVPAPTRLRAREAAIWAPVRRRIVARTEPSAHAVAVATIPTRTPEGTANVAVVTGARTEGGHLWVRLSLPILPNGTDGWVPRSALGGYTAVDTRLVVSLRALQATLYRGGRPILRVPVGVGVRSSPTPRGTFYIRDKLTRFASPFYGPVAFGTSARSEVLTDWPAGGFIGIHGTDRPDLIPGRISHGCIRLRNDDIVRLSRLLPVGSVVAIGD